jgi:hypothetical protein
MIKNQKRTKDKSLWAYNIESFLFSLTAVVAMEIRAEIGGC